MSPTLVVVLIVVVWLIVLAPLVLRRQRPISHAGEAFDETRVLYEGRTGELRPVRKTARMAMKFVRSSKDKQDDDLEVVEAYADDGEAEESLLIEEPPKVIDGEVLDTDVVAEESASGDVVRETIEHGQENRGGSTAASVLFAADGSEDREIFVAEDYLGPSDYLHPQARRDAALHYEGSVDEDDADARPNEPEEEAAAVEDSLLSDEEIEFARSRAGRGGYDPERDQRATLDRYARRRRTLLGLCIAVVLTFVLGLVAGGWSWLLPTAAILLTAAYLAALRTQVSQEKQLRVQRIRHLRRARLGVSQSAYPASGQRLGATVVEIDDASPDFEHLPFAEMPSQEPSPTDDHSDAAQQRVS